MVTVISEVQWERDSGGPDHRGAVSGGDGGVLGPQVYRTQETVSTTIYLQCF